MDKVKKSVHQAALLNHWHLSVDGQEEECGPFSLMSERAVHALWQHCVPTEQACEGYPSRTNLRCDRCHACRVYDRMEAAVHWLRSMREAYFVDRNAFEVRRCDMTFDEVLPGGDRLTVKLRDPRTPCFLHDEPDVQSDKEKP